MATARTTEANETVTRTDQADPAARGDSSPVEARLWQGLREVEDPEIPVSLVDMGLIVELAYEPATRTARITMTFTAMGCPAMDMIQDDVRERLLRDPAVDQVDIEIVWDPIWTRRRLSEAAKDRMRKLGISA